MIKTVDIKSVKPNPFNARSDYAEEPIAELAKEIEKVGFWAGALRARMKDGTIELCFGHRRLMALKKLGRKEVQVDIVKLDDDEMAMQGLAENLQRQGLNDMEKAEGIRGIVELLAKKNNGRRTEAWEEVKILLGYKTVEAVQSLVKITEYEAPVKKLISERKISAKAATAARILGGDKHGTEMVKTAAREKMSQHSIEKLSQSLDKILDKGVKEKFRAKIAAGEITEPKEVERKAEPMLQAKARKNEPPPDLIIVIMRWTDSIQDWRKALREVIPYRDYIDRHPRIAKQFREQVRGLISELEQFVPREID